MLRMTLRAGVYTDNCVPFACPCNPVHVACCAALRRDWHEAPVRCDAPSRSLSDVKRTWRAHRERVDATRLPSRPGEFHPEPLTDPDLTLSRHPARAIARRLPPSIEHRVPPG